MLTRFLLIIAFAATMLSADAQQKKLFNDSWEFVKGADTVFSADMIQKNGRIAWEKISLPHTANIEPVEKKSQQWQGICFYRKFFSIPASSKGKHIAIQFEAAMQEADIYLNGRHIFKHLGGYLPFYIDVSDKVNTGSENCIVVQLDNRDNPLIPPGKTLHTLDFNYYSGIYRNAWLITKEKLYITDAVAANRVAGGGVFVHYENITPQLATLIVRTELGNDFANSRNARVRIKLSDKTGKPIAAITSASQPIAAATTGVFLQTIPVKNPALWSTENPYLYQLTVEALENDKVIDRETVRTGIRSIRIERDAFYLNDKKLKIRGTNRHQDYPYVGNALSDNSQFRDAYKIRQAGFNFVRSSHYPQSPAFLDACDELGIMVMDAIPGWQFVGNDIFRANSYRDMRDMIRRDRNHASIILWETSLNESDMKKDFMQKAHDIVREEMPFEGAYSAGWVNDVYDVFLPARQHGKAPDYWKKYNKEQPLLIAEYGDWEYYAQNAGFNQTAFKDLKPEERTSRQLRGFGEKRLLQQSLNYQEAHNDNLYGNALGDANWLMFDYNRGYAEDIESSGIMDIMRLPKFSFYFYQSQVDALATHSFNKPMLFIANYWQVNSDTLVKVYSNCDEVELFLNDRSLGRQKPDKDKYSTNLPHPPFTFHVPSFQPGSLKAMGYLKNRKAIEQIRMTPGPPVAIRLRADYSGRDLKAGRNDMVFVYAEIVDAKGTVVHDAADPIEFTVTGNATIVGENPRAAEAGIATVLVKAGAKPGAVTISARTKGLKQATLVLNAK
jgi:beta-galactosidase